MQYTIQNIQHEPHDLDDEIIFFQFEVHYQSPTPLISHHSCHLENLLNYLKIKQPTFYAFWEHTRVSLELWGPAHQSTINAIGSEAIEQLYGYLVDYYKDNDYLESDYERVKANAERTVEQQITDMEKLEAKLKEIDEKHHGIKNEQNRYRQFCKQAEIKLREVSLEVYPEIAEMEPEQLRAFKHLFETEIMHIHTKLEKLLFPPDL